MIVTENRLTNLQLELIKMFKYNLDEKQLMEVKELLIKYFVNCIDTEMDKVWVEKKWSDSMIESISNQHIRTPYK